MRISENRLRAIIRGIVKESIQPTAKRRNLRESDPMMSEYVDDSSYPGEVSAYDDQEELYGDYEDYASESDPSIEDAYIPPSDETTYGVPIDDSYDSDLTGVGPLSMEDEDF